MGGGVGDGMEMIVAVKCMMVMMEVHMEEM